MTDPLSMMGGWHEHGVDPKMMIDPWVGPFGVAYMSDEAAQRFEDYAVKVGRRCERCDGPVIHHGIGLLRADTEYPDDLRPNICGQCEREEKS